MAPRKRPNAEGKASAPRRTFRVEESDEEPEADVNQATAPAPTSTAALGGQEDALGGQEERSPAPTSTPQAGSPERDPRAPPADRLDESLPATQPVVSTAAQLSAGPSAGLHQATSAPSPTIAGTPLSGSQTAATSQSAGGPSSSSGTPRPDLSDVSFHMCSTAGRNDGAGDGTRTWSQVNLQGHSYLLGTKLAVPGMFNTVAVAVAFNNTIKSQLMELDPNNAPAGAGCQVVVRRARSTGAARGLLADFFGPLANVVYETEPSETRVDSVTPMETLPSFVIPVACVAKAPAVSRGNTLFFGPPRPRRSATLAATHIARLLDVFTAGAIYKLRCLVLGDVEGRGEAWVPCDLILQNGASRTPFSPTLATALESAAASSALIAFTGKSPGPNSRAEYSGQVWFDGALVVRVDPSSPRYDDWLRSSTDTRERAANAMPDLLAPGLLPDDTPARTKAKWHAAYTGEADNEPRLRPGQHAGVRLQLVVADILSFPDVGPILPCVIITPRPAGAAHVAPAFVADEAVLQSIPRVAAMGVTLNRLTAEMLQEVVESNPASFSANVTTEPSGNFARITAVAV